YDGGNEKRHDDYDNVNLRGKQEGMKTILAYSEERKLKSKEIK
ncbi:12926_t:CDS:1, partial [Entrophospora sp. SA101]